MLADEVRAQINQAVSDAQAAVANLQNAISTLEQSHNAIQIVVAGTGTLGTIGSVSLQISKRHAEDALHGALSAIQEMNSFQPLV